MTIMSPFTPPPTPLVPLLFPLSQAQNHRLTVLKAELDAERTRADAAEAAAADARGDAANARAALEAHVAELLARTEEVAALKEAVAALGGGGGGRESGGGDGGGDALPAAPRSDTRAAAHARRMEDAAKDIEVNRLAAAMLAEAEEEAEGSEF